MGCLFMGKNMSDHDPVNHPLHYTSHPSGVECIEITEHMGFNLGNAIKYLWRHGFKPEHFVDATAKAAIQDLRKAIWCIDREIQRLERINEDQIEIFKEEKRDA